MMSNRIRWMAAGLFVGVSGSLWVERKVKAIAGRYSPSGIAGNATARARGIPGDFRAAIVEGREAMRAREAELRRGSSPERLEVPSGRNL
jgi:hypothetical protein